MSDSDSFPSVLRAWEEEAMTIIQGPPRPRQILWIHTDPLCEAPCTGKTAFMCYVQTRFPGCVLRIACPDTCFNDIIYIYRDGQNIIWFDVPRAFRRADDAKLMTFYSNLEHLSDGGRFVCSKYDGSIKTITAHIVVTSHLPPDTTLLPSRFHLIKASL